MESTIENITRNVDERVQPLLSFSKRRISMEFYTVRDFRTSSKKIWNSVCKDGEAIVTSNGKPIALLLDIGEGGFEETLRAVRQAKAMMAFNELRAVAKENGYLSEAEIEEEIASFRKERASDEGGN